MLSPSTKAPAHARRDVPRHVRWARRLAPCLAAPLATFAVLLAAMALTGVYPFGDVPFVARDGVLQYVGFHGWFHQVLTGEDSLVYSFSKGLGGGTFALYAYYLSSPLALAAAFVRPEHMAQALTLIMVAKICLASLTCAVYLTSRTGSARVPVALMGTCYALASWTFADGQNVMWLDGLVMLPLVALGVWRVARGGGAAVLFLSCLAAIFFNWYTAYTLCLFSIPYFFVELLCCRPRGKRLRTTLRYAAAMTLAVLGGMVILLPVGISQIGSESIDGTSWFLSSLTSPPAPLSVADLARSLVDVSRDFSGQGNSVKVPLALLLAAVAAVASPMPRRLKAGLGCLAALLMCSFLFKPLDMVWTAFVRADSYNPRYAYLLTLVLSLCAAWTVAWACERMTAARGRALLAPLAGGALVPAGGLIGALVIAVYGLSLPGLYGYASNSVQGYERYMEAVAGAVDKIEERDQGSLYRIGTAFGSSSGAMMPLPYEDTTAGVMSETMTTGQDMALGISSLAHYSSTASGPMKQLLGSLGYCSLPGTRGITSYQDPLFLADSLLGVRYVLDTQAPPGCEESVAALEPGAPADGEAHAYVNDHALPVGYAVDEGAGDTVWTGDPFENQKTWLSGLLGRDAGELYAPATIEEADEDGTSLSWTVTPAQDGPLYLRVSWTARPVAVFCDGELLQSTGNFEYDNNVMCLGERAAGETVTVTLHSDAGITRKECAIEARTLDLDRAVSALDELGAHTLDATFSAGGTITGTATVGEGQKLLITVPLEAGWTATVDGREVELEDVDGLIAVPMEAGTHEVALEYHTPGLIPGAIISAAGCALAGAWAAVAARRRGA